eukprot:CAMPEP_0196748696 /NCGR_PEP_ID=MMETSP1091-20130531/74275_1 /TAXON_ID=302021 /ORGANISM="Rhodomonas sp., Strain CCMP768" /LENGTH=94 /DNA_ID=CAMNT_0042096051 /DNA_START=20 /DNA_END=301 /DNA_ORIENTATION=+
MSASARRPGPGTPLPSPPLPRTQPDPPSSVSGRGWRRASGTAAQTGAQRRAVTDRPQNTLSITALTAPGTTYRSSSLRRMRRGARRSCASRNPP